jgi:hypothetical protein
MGDLTSESYPDAQDPRMVAAIDLIGRSGARNFQIRYSDDVEPLVWVADAEWPPAGRLCGAGFTPTEAAMALLDSAVDGGLCAHCGKPSGVTDDWRSDMPLADVVCWFVYDPETQRFRRSCEGETSGRAYGRDPKTGRVVGRNDPCPCGSGQKWKRCHGAR